MSAGINNKSKKTDVPVECSDSGDYQVKGSTIEGMYAKKGILQSKKLTWRLENHCDHDIDVQVRMIDSQHCVFEFDPAKDSCMSGWQTVEAKNGSAIGKENLIARIQTYPQGETQMPYEVWVRNTASPAQETMIDPELILDRPSGFLGLGTLAVILIGAVLIGGVLAFVRNRLRAG